jgi:hypothetical protein
LIAITAFNDARPQTSAMKEELQHLAASSIGK